MERKGAPPGTPRGALSTGRPEGRTRLLVDGSLVGAAEPPPAWPCWTRSRPCDLDGRCSPTSVAGSESLAQSQGTRAAPCCEKRQDSGSSPPASRRSGPLPQFRHAEPREDSAALLQHLHLGSLVTAARGSSYTHVESGRKSLGPGTAVGQDMEDPGSSPNCHRLCRTSANPPFTMSRGLTPLLKGP